MSRVFYGLRCDPISKPYRYLCHVNMNNYVVLCPIDNCKICDAPPGHYNEEHALTSRWVAKVKSFISAEEYYLDFGLFRYDTFKSMRMPYGGPTNPDELLEKLIVKPTSNILLDPTLGPIRNVYNKWIPDYRILETVDWRFNP